jgi:hypothetical protein
MRRVRLLLKPARGLPMMGRSVRRSRVHKETIMLDLSKRRPATTGARIGAKTSAPVALAFE